MENLININETYEKVNLINAKLNNREFEECVFMNCNFSNADFSYNTFIDCEFINCNLTMLQMNNVSLKSVVFKNCKLLGILFNNCDDFLFQVEFQDCILDYASFANKKMVKTNFHSCSMKEVTFIGTNLTSSIFENCNLENGIFNDTILAGVDFTTAYQYKIDPEINQLKRAKFSTTGILGLLDKYDIVVNQ